MTAVMYSECQLLPPRPGLNPPLLGQQVGQPDGDEAVVVGTGTQEGDRGGVVPVPMGYSAEQGDSYL